MDSNFSWEPPYLAAVLETDNSRLNGLIYEAMAAIEQRLLSPLEPDSEEERAIKSAQTSIAMIRAERGIGFHA